MIRISFAAAVAALLLGAAPSFADEDCNSCRTQDGWQIVSAQPAQGQRFFIQAQVYAPAPAVTEVEAGNTTAGACAMISANASQDQISVCDSSSR